MHTHGKAHMIEPKSSQSQASPTALSSLPQVPIHIQLVRQGHRPHPSSNPPSATNHFPQPIAELTNPVTPLSPLKHSFIAGTNDMHPRIRSFLKCAQTSFPQRILLIHPHSLQAHARLRCQHQSLFDVHSAHSFHGHSSAPRPLRFYRSGLLFSNAGQSRRSDASTRPATSAASRASTATATNSHFDSSQYRGSVLHALNPFQCDKRFLLEKSAQT